MAPLDDRLTDSEHLLADPEAVATQRLRSRLGFTMRLGAAAGFTYGLVITLQGHGWPSGYPVMTWAVLLYGLYRWSLQAPDMGRLSLGIHLMAGSATVLLCWHAWLSGMNDSFAVWTFCVVPIAVAALGNLRALLFWMSVALICVAVINAFAALSVVPATQTIPMTAQFVVFCQLVLVAMASMFAASAIFANDDSLRRLHAAYSVLLNQKMRLDVQADALSRNLHDAQLARAAADSANQAKSSFLAIMSHEIRTPLNGIIGLNSLLLDRPLDPQARQYVELARQSGDILLGLINDFLDHSRIEAGQLTLELLPLHPEKVISESIATVSASAQRNDVHLDSEIDAPPVVRGDAQRVRQILINLLGNAVKFSPHGSVHVRCRRLREDGRRIWLRIEVQDNGIGIEPAIQQQLFQPFIQGDTSTTRRFGGTGLGLSICRALAQRMGGCIGVESKPGEGSLFWVELPFDEAAPGTHIVDEHAVGHVHRTFQGRVLVAEDNRVNQVVARAMLERHGLSVDVVSDGRQAVQAIDAGHYDLVLMDCDMPHVDGFEATRMIRGSAGPRAQTCIVAMTAGVLTGDRDRCRDVGMNDYLPKPVHMVDLERVLARWLRTVEA